MSRPTETDETTSTNLLRNFSYALPFRGKPPKKKFVLLMHPRSGSGLLKDLLNCNPTIRCDGEILLHKVPAPHLYAHARSRKVNRPVYGFKLTTWQITVRQGFADPTRFIRRLHNQGWQFLYLERKNVLRQALSMIVAKDKLARGLRSKGLFHHRASEGIYVPERLHIDCDKLLWYIAQREKEMRESKEALQDLPHLTFTYEDDLLKPEHHQRTANKIFDFLEAQRVQVETKLVRTSSEKLADTISNYDEIVRALANSPYASLLDSNTQASTRRVA